MGEKNQVGREESGWKGRIRLGVKDLGWEGRRKLGEKNQVGRK